MVIRSTLHKWFPQFILQHPQALIGRVDIGLSDVYDLATRLGIIPKHRRINQKIRQDYFEQHTGMVNSSTAKKQQQQAGWGNWSMLVLAIAGAAGAVTYLGKGVLSN